MGSIRIISNPYDKEVVFNTIDTNTGEWVDIRVSNPTSDLLKEEYVNGVFPFKVKKIVDTIIREYSVENDPVEIIFEGTDDEFEEISFLCEDEKYADSVKLVQSSRQLANAREILPGIKDLFKEIKDLVYESISDKSRVDRDFNRLTETADDIVPICVLGNYSSGKSTFINALIGVEVMPSGADPVTAKVYRISRESNPDIATIKFEVRGSAVTVVIKDKKYTINGEIEEEDFNDDLMSALDAENGDIYERVYAALEVLNDYESDSPDVMFSDLIHVTVPFKNGLWGSTSNNFVIFDTPGSNSASNGEHLQSLQKALTELSNGLIVFISKFDTLDSLDNENLYLEIDKLKEMDSRFTMVVVNQADSADIEKNHDKKVLRMAVPKKLHADNIMFVSSIMGLGSKTSGVFRKEYCSELYDEKLIKYSDERQKYYKQLFKYNIMPEQLKKKSDASAEKIDNYVYANSGLFSIEEQLQTFASKYSSYNKCQQSLLFLTKIKDITSEEIQKKIEEIVRDQKIYEEKLDAREKALIERLDNECDNLNNSSKQEYPMYLHPFVEEVTHTITKEELTSIKEEFLEIQKESQSLSEREGDQKKAFADLKENFVEGVQNARSSFSFDKLVAIKDAVVNDVNQIVDTSKKKSETEKSITKAVSNQVVTKVSIIFDEHMDIGTSITNQQSKVYWEKTCEEVKNSLLELVSNSDELSEKNKKELSDIIIRYNTISFDTKAKEKFKKAHFERMDLHKIIFGNSDEISIPKLLKEYNNMMNENMTELETKVQESHIRSFDKWFEKLVDEIKENIHDLNPELKDLVNTISQKKVQKNDLVEKRERIDEYYKMIFDMMDWKNV